MGHHVETRNEKFNMRKKNGLLKFSSTSAKCEKGFSSGEFSSP